MQRTWISVTLASSGSYQDLTVDPSEPTDPFTAGPKTALDCDVVTLARDLRAQARELKSQDDSMTKSDPMEALYRPLGIKDVQGALCTAYAKPR